MKIEFANGNKLEVSLNNLPFKQLSITNFLIAGLLFFLPFINIKCNQISFGKITGFEMVKGIKLKEKAKNFERNILKEKEKNNQEETSKPPSKSSSDSDFFDETREKEIENTLDEKYSANSLMEYSEIEKPVTVLLIGFVVTFLAILISLFKFTYAGLVAMLLGIANIICLLIFFIGFEIIKAETFKGYNLGGNSFLNELLSIQLSFWFYLSIFFSALGCYCGFKNYRRKLIQKRDKEIEDFLLENPIKIEP